ncbi:hypothetical protein BDW22DRAFT_1241280 [Trametopsis cervina]|nr:hypothetical protein BDW22DRAFT_1241280 [Trametopsis cervina]
MDGPLRQSEYDVCVSCGSIEQCPHDQEDTDRGSAITPSLDTTTSRPDYTMTGITYAPKATDTTEVDTCDMVSNLPIPPHSEVFNTYGEHLTNADLLSRYGFALEGNENDVVSFDMDHLPNVYHDVPGAEGSMIDIARQVLASWPRYERWEHSTLVYQPYVATTAHPSTPLSAATHGRADGASVDRRSHRTRVHMCVNSDARISHDLWVCCALLSWTQTQRVVHTGRLRVLEETVADLVRLADRQLHWESQLEFGTENKSDMNDDKGDYDSREGSNVTQSLDKVCSFALQGLVIPYFLQVLFCLALLFSRAKSIVRCSVISYLKCPSTSTASCFCFELCSRASLHVGVDLT